MRSPSRSTRPDGWTWTIWPNYSTAIPRPLSPSSARPYSATRPRRLGDGRRLSVGVRSHQAGARRSGDLTGPAVCAQRRGAAAGAARGPPAVGHHREAGRALDSGRRHRGVRPGHHGHGSAGAAHRRERVLVGGGARLFSHKVWSMNHITRIGRVALAAVRGRHGCGAVEPIWRSCPLDPCVEEDTDEGVGSLLARGQRRGVGGRCGRSAAGQGV